MVGMLLWLSRCTRPDISFGVIQLARRVLSWDSRCQAALHQMVMYLHGTKDVRLHFMQHRDDQPSDMRVETHTDADWRSPRSQTGTFTFVTSLRGSFHPIGWGSAAQNVTATSSAASEMIAAHSGCYVSLNLVDDLLANRPPQERTLHLRIDNQTAIDIMSRGFSSKLATLGKIAGLRVDALRDLIDSGLLKVDHIRSHLNRSDIFTKVLGKVALRPPAPPLGPVARRGVPRMLLGCGRRASASPSGLPPAVSSPCRSGDSLQRAASGSHGPISRTTQP